MRNAPGGTFVQVSAGGYHTCALDVAGSPRKYLLIDTAGIQRRKGIKDSIEFYSQTELVLALQKELEVARADGQGENTLLS